jgi:hypothetical protein
VTLGKKGEFRLANLPPGAVRFLLETLEGQIEVGRAVVPAEDLLLVLPAR